DAMNRVIDVLLALGLVRTEKCLVRGEAHQVEAEQESAALETLQVIVGLGLHLPVQDLDAIEAHLGGEVDVLFDIAQVFVTELPERVRRNADAIGACVARLGLVRSNGGETDGGGGGGQETAAAGVHARSSPISRRVASHDSFAQ